MPKKQSDSDMENPEEFAAWAFAAGIPDPRGEQFGHQPLIPAPCFASVSRMLWDLGFRHHGDLQTKWVADYRGPERNFVAVGLSDVDPQTVVQETADVVAEQFPALAAQLSAAPRGAKKSDGQASLQMSLERLRAVKEELDRRAGREDDAT